MKLSGVSKVKRGKREKGRRRKTIPIWTVFFLYNISIGSPARKRVQRETFTDTVWWHCASSTSSSSTATTTGHNTLDECFGSGREDSLSLSLSLSLSFSFFLSWWSLVGHWACVFALCRGDRQRKRKEEEKERKERGAIDRWASGREKERKRERETSRQQSSLG